MSCSSFRPTLAAFLPFTDIHSFRLRVTFSNSSFTCSRVSSFDISNLSNQYGLLCIGKDNGRGKALQLVVTYSPVTLSTSLYVRPLTELPRSRLDEFGPLVYLSEVISTRRRRVNQRALVVGAAGLGSRSVLRRGLGSLDSDVVLS